MIRVHNISCQHLDKDEIFLGADHRVYPCCYLYDSKIQFDEDIKRIYNHYGEDFNNLKVHTLKEILDNPWFSGELEESLNKDHPLNCARCWKSCGDGGIRKTKKEVDRD